MSRVIALRAEAIADFRAWWQLVAEEIGDRPRSAVLVWQDDDDHATANLHQFQCDPVSLTYLAALLDDYARRQRD